MASEWRESTWGEEISLEYGKRLKGYADATGPYRVFGTNGPVGRTDEPLADGPGIILGRKGAYRGVHFSREPFFVIDTAYYVAPKSDLNMRWLYYAIIHYQLAQLNDGSPIPSTTRSAVYVRKLKIPPKPTQQRVAAVLGALDDKIELNRRMDRLLEEQTRAIFRAWFVDFEPVRAKAAGAAGFPGMPQPLFDQLPTTFTPSPLGEIPQGWEVLAAQDVANVAIGKTPPRKQKQWFTTDPRNGVRWMSIKDMGQAGMFIRETSECLVSEAIEKFNVKKIPDNTVVLSFKLTVGRVAITEGTMLSNEAIAHFNLDDSEYIASSIYLYSYLKEFDYSALGSTSSIATAVNSKTIKAMPIVVAHPQLVESFDQLVGQHIRQIKLLQREISVLEQTRDTLLPKLISGEISVSNIEGGDG